MPLYTIEDSKFTSETISIVQDFSDMLVGGETIVGTPTIDITLLTGTDSNPNNLLYLGITTTPSTVEQRFKLGVPGCIYSIVYTVITTFPHTYEKETFLAVLPMAGNVSPQFTAILETSCLYPYETTESLQGSQILTSGRLTVVVYNYFDQLKGFQLLLSGVQTKVITIYTILPESITGSQLLLGGYFVTGTTITYSFDYDSLKGHHILVSGALVPATVITYSYEVDSLQGSQLLTGGTFP